MNRLKTFVLNPTRIRSVRRAASICGLGLALIATSSQVNAACTYTLESQWDNGFSAKIRITNTNSAPISSWSIGWQYAGGNRVLAGSSYNVTLTGSNPYTATNISWNGNIAVGGFQEFGFQGTKAAGAAEIPVLTGAACGTATSSTAAVSSTASSVAVSSVRSSVSPSSTPVISSRASSSSISVGGGWQLSATESYLNFVTTKNAHTIEVHKFDSLSGSLTNAGVATLIVDLASVNTANTLRDQRLRDLFFETGLFPSAIATFNVDTAVVSAIPVGQSAVVDLAGTLDLHGVAALMSTKVLVQKATATRVVVQSVAPVIVKSADHNLTAGVEALRAAVGITSVSGIAPVDFVLVFNAQ
ncbi:MAG: cellulose binding domain-containing protein [Pseudomonadota bacterium]